MNVILYESSSFGGCYEYAKCLLKAYSAKGCNSKLVLPRNSGFTNEGVVKILLDDKPDFSIPLFNKLHFLYRHFLNPFILFFYLLRQPASLVILNDFEQLSAPVWGKLYRWFLRKHRISVFLHDPDRDKYPPSRTISAYTMKALMRSVEVVLFHEYLPAKEYYSFDHLKFLKVPHGVYSPVSRDEHLFKKICKSKSGRKIMSIVGNIREEKNYSIAIEVLVDLEDFVLVIAGAPAHSGVSTEKYKQIAEDFGVSNRVVWIEKFLTDQELAAVIEVSDIILLYYSSTFTSQSGILNLVAPYKKMIVASNIQSSLSRLVKEFGIGVLVEADNVQALKAGIISASKCTTEASNWDRYCEYASWDNQVELVINAI